MWLRQLGDIQALAFPELKNRIEYQNFFNADCCTVKNKDFLSADIESMRGFYFFTFSLDVMDIAVFRLRD